MYGMRHCHSPLLIGNIDKQGKQFYPVDSVWSFIIIPLGLIRSVNDAANELCIRLGV